MPASGRNGGRRGPFSVGRITQLCPGLPQPERRDDNHSRANMETEEKTAAPEIKKEVRYNGSKFPPRR